MSHLSSAACSVLPELVAGQPANVEHRYLWQWLHHCLSALICVQCMSSHSACRADSTSKPLWPASVSSSCSGHVPTHRYRLLAGIPCAEQHRLNGRTCPVGVMLKTQPSWISILSASVPTRRRSRRITVQNNLPCNSQPKVCSSPNQCPCNSEPKVQRCLMRSA